MPQSSSRRQNAARNSQRSSRPAAWSTTRRKSEGVIFVIGQVRTRRVMELPRRTDAPYLARRDCTRYESTGRLSVLLYLVPSVDVQVATMPSPGGAAVRS